jgi:hypothetical protein
MHESGRELTVVAAVASTFEDAGIAYALIGAAALAVHGISRSTFDLDLLAVDRGCLEPEMWAGLGERGISVEIRRGDAADPLAGVARFSAHGAQPVDLVIGRSSWQGDTLTRAGRAKVGTIELPVLRPSDLVLLKLYAGGPQDAWDVQQLLAGADRKAIVREVESHLPALPPRATVLWRQISVAGDR